MLREIKFAYCHEVIRSCDDIGAFFQRVQRVQVQKFLTGQNKSRKTSKKMCRRKKMCRAKICRAADFPLSPGGHIFFSSDRHIFSSGRAKLNRRFLSQKCAGQFSPRPHAPFVASTACMGTIHLRRTKVRR